MSSVTFDVDFERDDKDLPCSMDTSIQTNEVSNDVTSAHTVKDLFHQGNIQQNLDAQQWNRKLWANDGKFQPGTVSTEIANPILATKTNSVSMENLNGQRPKAQKRRLIDQLGEYSPSSKRQRNSLKSNDVQGLTPADEDRLKELQSQMDFLKKTESDLENKKSILEEIKVEPGKVLEFPNLALEALKAGLLKEKITNDQLNGYINEAQKHQKDIDLLLDLSAQLIKIKLAEGETMEMPAEMKATFDKLKEHGIDIWKGPKYDLDRDVIAEVKLLSGSQIDKLRSNVQVLMTTKIQTLIQLMGAILDCVKHIIQLFAKLMSAILNKMGTR
jgi:hypothetical protein